jgi:hypothetical protein
MAHFNCNCITFTYKSFLLLFKNILIRSISRAVSTVYRDKKPRDEIDKMLQR